MHIATMTRTHAFHVLLTSLTASSAAAQVTAIRAGGLVDPDAGIVSTNQIILIEDGRFRAIGADVTIPRGAEVIDLSHLTVLPGLVDAHNHLALTYKAKHWIPQNTSSWYRTCSATGSRRHRATRRHQTIEYAFR